MGVKRKNEEERGFFDMVEEAAHLLRSCRLGAFLSYLAGTGPFLLGLLYFWADMSRNGDAHRYAGAAAFGLALLFLWMKAWQSVFCSELWAAVSGRAPAPWTLGRAARLALIQLVVHPWGLFLLPVAFVLALPFGWVYAYFQNVTVFSGLGEDALEPLSKRSWAQAWTWPKQNHLFLGGIFLFATFVFMDLAILLSILPMLLKTLLGVETVFSKSIWSLFNTTFFSVVAALTYLCLDPLVKAFYTLRCFYGESLVTGLDLRSELQGREESPGFGPGAAALVLFLLVVPAWAAPARAPAVQEVRAEELDKAITEAMDSPEYRWHFPRVKPPEEEKKATGVVEEFVTGTFKAIGKGLKAVGRWIERFFNWLSEKLKRESKVDKRVRVQDWHSEWLYVFLWVLLAMVAAALGVLLYRAWNRREKPAAVGEAVLPVPDLADEGVSGSELPEDGWLGMARELMAAGDFRLALRAFYLSSLALLASRKRLNLARFKSTLDYERELDRRAHHLPDLLGVFRENGRLFDRGWYGAGAVTREAVELFASNHERIRSLANQE